MKYITGNTNKEYIFSGLMIPKKSYRQEDLDIGKSPVLKLDEKTFDEVLWTQKVFRELVEARIIAISDTPPSVNYQTTNQVKAELANAEASYSAKIKELEDENAVLKQKLQELSAEAESIKTEALAEISRLKHELAEKE